MKKHVIILLALIIVSQAATTFAWGDRGHKYIAKQALETLPASMKQFSVWFEEIRTKSVDPDNRKGADKTEGPKHYIDIDYYKEFRRAEMPRSKQTLETAYTAEMVTRQGTLPWATLDTYNKLVGAMKAHNKALTLTMMADLAHYVADAHQPMHTLVNYDGKLTNQKGIHARYEIEMIEKNYPELEASVKAAKPVKVKDTEDFVWNMIHDTHTLFPVLYYADSVAQSETGRVYNDLYYKIMWHYTRNVTIRQFNSAVEDLAALFYTAWLSAGSPQVRKFK